MSRMKGKDRGIHDEREELAYAPDGEPSAPMWSSGSATNYGSSLKSFTVHPNPVAAPPQDYRTTYDNELFRPNSPPPAPQQIFLEPPEEPKRYRAFIALTVVTVCIAMFIITMFVNDCPSHRAKTGQKCVLRFLRRLSFQPWRENPLLGPSSSSLLKLGALESDRVAKKAQVWRIFTSMWLHAGVFHLILNMIALCYISVRLEAEFAALRIGAVYIISGIGGSLLSTLFLKNQITVGASGALFGLIGATMSELLVNWGLYANRFCALFSLLCLIAINVALGLMPFVDNFSHLGGLLTGILLGFILLVKPHSGWLETHSATNQPAEEMQMAWKNSAYQHTVRIVASVLLIAGFAAAIVSIAVQVDANKGCSWCHYLSCVPTSLWDCNTTSNSGRVVCTVTTYNSGDGILICPNQTISSYNNLTSYSTSQLRSLCKKDCA